MSSSLNRVSYTFLVLIKDSCEQTTIKNHIILYYITPKLKSIMKVLGLTSSATYDNQTTAAMAAELEHITKDDAAWTTTISLSY